MTFRLTYLFLFLVSTNTFSQEGLIFRQLDIPNTSTVRFSTGERIFRLTSSSTNSSTDDDVDTFADGRYTARG